MRGSTGEGWSQFSSKDMHKELRSKISSSWLTQETSETIYLATLSKEVVTLNHPCRKISRSEVQKLSKDMLFEVVYIVICYLAFGHNIVFENYLQVTKLKGCNDDTLF